MIPLGGTNFILPRTLYHIFCQQNLLTKKKSFLLFRSRINLKKVFAAQGSQYSFRHSVIIDFLSVDQIETRGKKEKSNEEKKFVFFAKFFAVTRIWLIWLDIFVERVNSQKKSHADWTNRHMLEQMNHEKKRQTVTLQFTTMVPFCHTVNSAPPVSTMKTTDWKNITGMC